MKREHKAEQKLTSLEFFRLTVVFLFKVWRCREEVFEESLMQLFQSQILDTVDRPIHVMSHSLQQINEFFIYICAQNHRLKIDHTGAIWLVLIFRRVFLFSFSFQHWPNFSHSQFSSFRQEIYIPRWVCQNLPWKWRYHHSCQGRAWKSSETCPFGSRSIDLLRVELCRLLWHRR